MSYTIKHGDYCMTPYLLTVFIISLFLGAIFTPATLNFCKRKKLYDIPNERKIHKNAIPRLGGLSFFPSMMIAFIFFLLASSWNNQLDHTFNIWSASYLAGLLIIYTTGIIDDLICLTAKSKFVAQIIAASLLPMTGLTINNLYGLFGIYYLPYYAGVAVKMGYTPDGSGTQSTEVVTAMRNYFKYESSQMVYRNNNNGAEFVRRIRNLLLHKDVVYMSGSSLIGEGADAAGHAWVCGGYIDGDTVRYYMNWGWNGGGDNFFNLATNNMYISTQGYNFNQRQAFIEGMVPPADSNRFYVGIVEADPTHLGTAYPNPAIQSVVLPYNTQNAGDLVVYNIEGKAVATYRVAAGAGEVTVNVEQMPAGIYIYRLNSQSGRFTVTK